MGRSRSGGRRRLLLAGTLAPPQRPPRRLPHILVVDDNREIRESLALFLKKSGRRALTADNAEAARKALKEGIKEGDSLRMKPAEDVNDEDIKGLIAYVRAFKK